ncbi:putative reverse transcriptase domain-containing protein [Tanacetum coccineum]
MTSSEDVRLVSPDVFRANNVKSKIRKPHRSCKARVRVESSPLDDRGGKRVVTNPENDVIKKVLSDVRAGSINSLKFDMGSSNYTIFNCSLKKNSDAIGLSPTIDGSFIKEPLCSCNNSVLNSGSGRPVAPGSSHSDSFEQASGGVEGNASPDHSIPLDSTASAKTSMDFEFGKVDRNNGILKKPLGPLLNVQFGCNIPYNPFSMKHGVSKLDNGGRRISFTAEEVIRGGIKCSLQLYEYFVGTSMDYRVVRANLRKMWRVYGIVEITKTNSGIFYFKFSNEEGMKKVLESGPWMIQNIPLVLNLWEPGIWLEKVKPSSIPIWVCVYNIPLELCNGSSIGKIMSGIGKPLPMDKMTKERCLKKAGILDFARVLVEVSADDDLPNVLEIAYPPIRSSQAKVGNLDMKYQWKPPLCTHCHTFGHSTLAYKLRPRTDDENASAILKEALKVNSGTNDTNVPPLNDDGFVFVGRKNKPSDKKSLPPHGDSQMKQGKVQNRGGFNVGKSKQQDGMKKKNMDAVNNSKSDMPSDVVNQKKSLRQLSQDPNFKPKVLVRGSGSNSNSKVSIDEVVPTSNSFDLLSEEAMNEEYDTSIWPKLKGDVDDFIENGIYPSKEIRAEWSPRQMEYFYNNCHKFNLDPSYEDEEDEVNSDIDGIAVDMKPEFEVNNADFLVNNSADGQDVSNVLGNWEWVSNNSSCVGGTRIIVGWDPDVINLMVLDHTSQVLHCYVQPVNRGTCFFCSFVYAAIHTVDRRALWKALHNHKLAVKDSPWVILGDFNAYLDPFERSSGCSKITTAMSDFRECVADIEMKYIAMNGLKFTWNKKPGKVGGLLKKLDRVMGNVPFMSSFPIVHALFLPFMLSDHTPTVLIFLDILKPKPKPFKFHNYLSSKDKFLPTVSEVWSNKVDGCSMFSLVSKLKLLKKPLRKLNFDLGNLFDNVKRCKADLSSAQAAMCVDPFNASFREREFVSLKAFKSALKDEESFLKQKAKVLWLNEGDRNSKYFHNVVKGRLNRNRISYVEDMDSNAFHGSNMGEQFVNHFKSVLGMCSDVSPIEDLGGLFSNTLPESEALYMIRAVSDKEIKEALFSIDGNKAPGPDGFSA